MTAFKKTFIGHDLIPEMPPNGSSIQKEYWLGTIRSTFFVRLSWSYGRSVMIMCDVLLIHTALMAPGRQENGLALQYMHGQEKPSSRRKEVITWNV